MSKKPEGSFGAPGGAARGRPPSASRCALFLFSVYLMHLLAVSLLPCLDSSPELNGSKLAHVTAFAHLLHCSCDILKGLIVQCTPLAWLSPSTYSFCNVYLLPCVFSLLVNIKVCITSQIMRVIILTAQQHGCCQGPARQQMTGMSKHSPVS